MPILRLATALLYGVIGLVISGAGTIVALDLSVDASGGHSIGAPFSDWAPLALGCLGGMLLAIGYFRSTGDHSKAADHKRSLQEKT